MDSMQCRILVLLFLEKRGWRAEDSIFHDGESREYLYSRTLFFSRPLRANFSVSRPDWTDAFSRALPASQLGNGNWRVACTARSTRIHLRILSCHAIRRRCINRLSISECKPNFIEIHRRSAYLAELPLFDYHLRIFQRETMSLDVSSVRAFT